MVGRPFQYGDKVRDAGGREGTVVDFGSSSIGGYVFYVDWGNGKGVAHLASELELIEVGPASDPANYQEPATAPQPREEAMVTCETCGAETKAHVRHEDDSIDCIECAFAQLRELAVAAFERAQLDESDDQGTREWHEAVSRADQRVYDLVTELDRGLLLGEPVICNRVAGVFQAPTLYCRQVRGHEGPCDFEEELSRLRPSRGAATA